jgi:hypothetical protein
MNDINADIILERYRNAAFEYGQYLGKNSSKTNQWFDKIAESYNALKQVDSLKSLTKLLNDEDDSVRLWSASHLLFVEPDLAEKTLNDLKNNSDFLGFSAKITHQEWEKGRLNFDY